MMDRASVCEMLATRWRQLIVSSLRLWPWPDNSPRSFSEEAWQRHLWFHPELEEVDRRRQEDSARRMS
jgi:hypothetical protein